MYEKLTVPYSLNTGYFCFKLIMKIISSTIPVQNESIVCPVFSIKRAFQHLNRKMELNQKPTFYHN